VAQWGNDVNEKSFLMIKMMKVGNGNLLLVSLLLVITSSCSVSRQINKQASQILLKDTVISTGHIGICIYEPAKDQYWYNYNATKYFVPASNTKLFSLYAGMKYLGDSLVGLRYQTNEAGEVFLYPTGDPSFLHEDYKKQPVFDFLKSIRSNKWKAIVMNGWKSEHLGYGWSWNDYSDYYMAERSAMPVYGNVVNFSFLNDSLVCQPYGLFDLIPSDEFSFEEQQQFFSRDIKKLPANFSVKRFPDNNAFKFIKSINKFSSVTIPLIQNNALLNDILKDTLHLLKDDHFIFITDTSPGMNEFKTIHSQPTDSLFSPMMHRSDNFFAEQTLLMASNERLGYMNDEAIIDTLLNTDLKDIPQRPQWVDGSGLSRYNLFTPQDFIFILNKLKNDFGFERVKKILPTGGTGTLKRYFNSDSSFIYAKTGTLSNHVALSGFLITNKNKLLVFSILNNNYEGSTVAVRRAVEKFLQQIRKKY
jgi:D-alanyl-D-alanine carboxypeptidase/D-alanyl-D-alanine-endopeptidase (penicillin-binding protein 4)